MPGMNVELRTITFAPEDVEIREKPDGGLTFRGHAVSFDSWSQDLGGFKEQIARSAPNRAIVERQDVRHLINHDPNRILGRTASGTTKLSTDKSGLLVETDLPNTSYARDFAESSKRGDITQMSFGFIVPPGGDSWNWDTGGLAERTVNDMDLVDVSSVVYPAYVDSTGEVRAEVPAEVRALVAEHRGTVGPAEIGWDDSAGMIDFLDDISASLPSGPYNYCADCTTDGKTALVVQYDDSGNAQMFTVPIIMVEGEPVAADPSTWTEVVYEMVVADEQVARMVRSLNRLERRAGKTISAENAGHVQTIADALSTAGDSVAALIEAAGLDPNQDGEDDENDDDPVDASVTEYNSIDRFAASRRIALLELGADLRADKLRPGSITSGPDKGGYPITDAKSLEDAIEAIGRAKNEDDVKAHIIDKAHELGLTDKLPKGWA